MNKKKKKKTLKQKMTSDPYPVDSLIILKKGVGKTTLTQVLK